MQGTLRNENFLRIIYSVKQFDRIEQALDRCVGVTLKKCLLIHTIIIMTYIISGLCNEHYHYDYTEHKNCR